MSERKMVLGQTHEFRYVGVQPPLEDAHLELFLVEAAFSGETPKPSVQIEDDGSMTLGFDAGVFGEFANIPSDIGETSPFVSYCSQAATRVGNISLDTTVYYAGPGSMFSADNLVTV